MFAHSIDANLKADVKADRIIDFVITVYNLISTKGKMKSKKLSEMVKSIPSTI